MKSGDIFLMKLRGYELEKVLLLDWYIPEPVTQTTQLDWLLWVREHRN